MGPGNAGMQPLAHRTFQRMGILEGDQRRRGARGGLFGAKIGVSKQSAGVRKETPIEETDHASEEGLEVAESVAESGILVSFPGIGTVARANLNLR